MLTDIEIIIASLGLFLGFPHGTLDWYLHKEKLGRDVNVFIRSYYSFIKTALVYLVIGVPYILLWLLIPELALLLFLVFTAIHWGQEDLYYHTEVKNLDIFNNTKERVYMILTRGGMAVILPLVLYHQDYQIVMNIILDFFGREGKIDVLFRPFTRNVFSASFLVFLYLHLSHLDKYFRKGKRVIVDTILLSLWFLLVPVAISIPIYLAVYHSGIHISILYQEGINSIKKFMKIALPYSICSAIMLLSSIYLLPQSTESLLKISAFYLVFLSILTLPHTYITFKIDSDIDQKRFIKFGVLGIY